MPLSHAQVLLATIEAAIESDIFKLQTLYRRHELHSELILRILLTFLPECTPPATYIPLLQAIGSGTYSTSDFGSDEQQEPEGEDTQLLAEEEALLRVRSVKLLALSTNDHVLRTEHDTLAAYFVSFLLLRSRHIDVETGSLLAVQQLLEPFINGSKYLKLWMGTTICPLIRLNYEFTPEGDEPITLESFEQLRGGSALDVLLGLRNEYNTAFAADYIERLRLICIPWLQGEIYRRQQRLIEDPSKSSNHREHEPIVAVWDWVNNWLLHLADRNGELALEIACSDHLQGPSPAGEDVNLADDPDINIWIWGQSSPTASLAFQEAQRNFGRTCICLFYITRDADEATFRQLERLLLKVATYVGCVDKVTETLSNVTPSESLSSRFSLKAKSSAHRLLVVDLLVSSHPVTDLTIDSMLLAACYLKSATKLLSLQAPLTVAKTAQMGLVGTSHEQYSLLQRYLQIISDQSVRDDACLRVRTNILLLRSDPSYAGEESSGSMGVLSQLSPEEVETAFLRSLIAAGRHKLVQALYLSSSSLLTESQVEQAILSVALSTFDGATNGNRTRGGVKKASEIIAAYKTKLEASDLFGRLEALLRATHALSFYSLKMQNGAMCTPATIRVQTEPLALIDKVLAQNQDAYTSLDDLTRIARDFARSGLLVSSAGRLIENPTVPEGPHAPDTQLSFLQVDLSDLENTIQMASQIVASKAIKASLRAGDFDTAYSYVTARLAGTEILAIPLEYSGDMLWQTALAAGRFEPSHEPRSGPKYLRRLEQKMELLASALELAPPSAMAQVLEAWQECEAQVNVAVAKEAEADLMWDDSGNKRSSVRMTAGDRHLPGGFGAESWIPNAEGTGGRKWTGGDEAPMGLFDVARGAAAALQKSAFADRRSLQSGGAQRGLPDRSQGAGRGHQYSESVDRTRKRDMVSSAVTSGLVSGIGWVIGANPSREQ